jgi:hypothetical protein
VVVGAVPAAVVAVAGSSVVVVAAYGCTAEGDVADERGGSAGAHGESSCRTTATETVVRNTAGCSGEAIGGSGRVGRRRRQEPEAGARTSW